MIEIVPFDGTFLEQAEALFRAEWEREARTAAALAWRSPENRLRQLCGAPYGKLALLDGKPAGYLLFYEPWDGFFGRVRGTFSPLGGSAVTPGSDDLRGKILSRLTEAAMEDMARDGVFSLGISRFAHDEAAGRALVLGGFGIRCSDAITYLADVPEAPMPEGFSFEELPEDEFGRIRELHRALDRHLNRSPIFLTLSREDDWCETGGKRVFAALRNGEPAGFIAVRDECETFFTEGMPNICGMYVLPEHRGTGLAAALLSGLCRTLEREGETRLAVDCETLNPTALRFWGKYFTPFTYSYARRLDERCRDVE